MQLPCDICGKKIEFEEIYPLTNDIKKIEDGYIVVCNDCSGGTQDTTGGRNEKQA